MSDWRLYLLYCRVRWWQWQERSPVSPPGNTASTSTSLETTQTVSRHLFFISHFLINYYFILLFFSFLDQNIIWRKWEKYLVKALYIEVYKLLWCYKLFLSLQAAEYVEYGNFYLGHTKKVGPWILRTTSHTSSLASFFQKSRIFFFYFFSLDSRRSTN